jgi:uncharacterized protein DUF922
MAGTSVNDKGYKFKTKKLKGDTLEEIEKNCRKSGGVDPNDKSRKFYAVTSVKVDLRTGEDVWYPGGMHILNRMIATTPRYEKPEAHVSSEIELYAPANLSKLSKDAQKEWKRFETDLRKHEIEHHKEGLKLAEKLVAEVKQVPVDMKTETLNEAAMKKEALRLLGKKFISTFGGGEIEKRVNAAMADLDRRTHHGGVVLKTSIE